MKKLAYLLPIVCIVLVLLPSTPTWTFVSPLEVDYVYYLPYLVGGRPSSEFKGVGAVWQYPYTCEDIALTGATHFHDWTPWPLDCEGIKSVCMWWGLGSMELPTSPNCDVILLWNEPQYSTQSDVDPVIGASTWMTVEIEAGEREFTTPCADAYWRDVWANSFYAQHGRWPTFDYVCVHSYPYILPGMDVEDAINQTKQEVLGASAWSLNRGGDGSVWLHEFGLWPAWGGDVTEYITEIVPWLEEQEVPYDWFALSHVGDFMAPIYDTSLVENGELTELGEAYVSASPTWP